MWHRLQALTTRQSRRSIVVVMLLLGALVSGLSAHAITRVDRARRQAMLDSNAAIVRSRIDLKTAAAVNVLESVRPLWSMRSAPTDADFKRYVRTGLAEGRGGPTTYAGLTDIAFVRRVRAGRTRAFVRSVRSERPQRYTPDLTDDRPHYIVDFHTSGIVLGTDLYPLPGRREALEAARDRGRAVASRWYVGVSDLDLPIARQRKLTLLAVPVYAGGRVPDTLGGRRTALIGWLVTPLYANEVLDDVAADLPVHMALYDAPDATVPIAAVGDAGPAALDDELRIDTLGREWLLRIGLATGAGARAVPGAPAALLAGLCLTVLLTTLFWLTSRLGALSEDRASTATARLRERDDYVRVIADRVPVGIADLDADGNVLWANDRLAQVFGLRGDHLLGLPWSALVHAEDREAVRMAHAASVADGEAFLVRHRLHGAEEDRWIEKAGAPTLDDDGNVVRVVAVVSDVSALVEFEERLRAARDQAVEASRMKSEFLADMSHEIRTPLNGVIGMADALARTELTRGQRSKIATLRTAATQLRDLLSDILDLARIEAGRLELDDVAFDPTEVISSVAALQGPDAFDKGLQLHVDVDAALPARVQGPQLRLRQALDNLLRNAVKFTRHGEVGLSATVVEGGRDTTTVRFDVTDTGVGVSAAMLESVFDPFIQADASDTRAHGGSGLGLAISRRLVEMMGGRLEVESMTNRGSRFSFTIDLQVLPEDPDPARTAADHGAVAAADGGRPLLLVVEDNPINQEVARELLAALGYGVEVAKDGARGVDAVRHRRFAAVLMDCQMPVMDGYEATARIRGLEAAQDRHTPIIAMTASAAVDDRQRCLAAGMDDYISKPVSADVLDDVLDRWVGARSHEETPDGAADAVMAQTPATGGRARARERSIDARGDAAR